MTEPGILIDLDGVIVDFIGGVIKWYDLDAKPVDFNAYDICHEIAGMTKGEFWGGLTEEFWTSLEFYPWAHDLLEYIKPYKPCILTSPIINGATAKQKWIMKNMNDYFREGRYLIGPGKHFAAGPDKILIDDSEAKIKRFKDAGGIGILFPQPWNCLRDRAARGSSLKDTLTALDAVMEWGFSEAK